jgi:hypothetical protein
MKLEDQIIHFEDTLSRMRRKVDQEIRANGDSEKILNLSESMYHLVCTIGNILYILKDEEEKKPWQ